MNKKNYSIFFFIGCFSIFLFVFSGSHLPAITSSFNKLSSQVFYHLNSKERLTQNIVVVRIDDHSLAKINKKWPFPRSLYAEALNILDAQGARAIGFDIVFQGGSESEEEDAIFRKALSSLKGKVILASYLGKTEVSSKLFSGAADVSFVDALEGKDGIVKKIVAVSSQDSFLKFCWAVELSSRYYGLTPQKQAQNIVLGRKTIPLDEAGVLAVNYLLKPKDFKTISFVDLIEGRFPQDFFNEKIVLIGATAEIIHDILLTPLGRMPGVFIQANALVNILNSKYLAVVHPALAMAILFSGLFLLAMIIISFSLIEGLFLCLGVLIVIFWLSIGLKFLGWDISYGALSVSMISFFIFGNLYNYFRFLAVITKIKAEMTIEPFSRLFKLRYLYERLNLETGSFPRKKRWLILAVFNGFSEATKGKNFEFLHSLWAELNSIFLKNGELWAQCGQAAVVGVATKRADLNKLKKELDTLFFEQEVSVQAKIGMLAINSSLNIRELVPLVVDELAKSKEEVIFFDRSRLPDHKGQRDKGEDMVSSLYTDSETKNQDLLKAIEKRIIEESKRQEAYLQFITALVTALESKDPYTEGHSENVCRYSLLLCDLLGLPNKEREKIRIAALLHDLGKIGIPDSVLHKE
ncbi:MAG: CHASE2 domain-containing protein, partial [Candidatus Omnitrophica bacterium]|nr:CHASE2 domain-containing protein [Candidatus Omnitrophota bacterium]